jgi:hypothetical protein
MRALLVALRALALPISPSASRDDGLPPANRREHVIPALTDHLEDKGGVIGLAIVRLTANTVNLFYNQISYS